MNKEYFDNNFLTMQEMMKYIITNMESLTEEIQSLKEENNELKLNLIVMNPMYSNEQRNNAIEQLRIIKEKKENTLASTFK